MDQAYQVDETKHPLSCHPQRGVFGSLENERKRREKRENGNQNRGCM